MERLENSKAPFLYLAALFLLLAPSGWAKAYHPSAKEMIKEAEFIALVCLGAPQAIATKADWTYGEVSNAHLSEAIKGALPANFKIHGAENFICAQCHFKKGESLVFLRRNKDLYVGQAWEISCLPVKAGKVDWFSNLDKHSCDAQLPIADCIKQIKDELKH